MHTPFQKSLRHLLPIFKEAGIRFALVGGLAVTFRGEERTTKDIDLALAVNSDSEAEGVLQLFLASGYRIEALLEQTSQKRLATARLISPLSSNLIIDLMFSSCGIEREIVQEATLIEILPKISVPVATRSHLIAMKILSVNNTTRTRDKDDLIGLLRRASKREVANAQEALELIKKRGFHRKKRLTVEFKKFQKIAGLRLGKI